MLSLPELAQALLQPSAYPEITRDVELCQTQMSFVFLTTDLVYKVKKPVALGYLDYTTLEKRLACCQREIMLNRRLCPEIYLGVVPITRDSRGISVEGQGDVMEYAVKMRRLPQTRMMHELLGQNEVTPAMVDGVAQKLIDFHRHAETSAEISTFGSLEAITRNTQENFEQTEKYLGRTISEETYRHLRDHTRRFIRDNAPLFRKRMSEGKIRDGHGDLHAAHVCFTDDICIYDCIEFNDRFRYCDVAAEVAFLAMDLDHYGRADLSCSFVEAYTAHSGDDELPGLVDYYKGYFAYVRGKVDSFKLDDPYIPQAEKDKILAIARSYFELAESYL